MRSRKKLGKIQKIILCFSLCTALAIPAPFPVSGNNAADAAAGADTSDVAAITPAEGSPTPADTKLPARDDILNKTDMLLDAADELTKEIPDTADDLDITGELKSDASTVSITAGDGNHAGSDVLIDGYIVRELTAETIAASKGGIGSPLQKLLTEARDNATAERPYKIIVAPGTYSLAQHLRIYGNTYLCLDGVNLTMSDSLTSYVLKVGAASDTQTGYYYKNITIDGGKNGSVWDKNGKGGTTMKVGHAENFRMENITMKNSLDGHMMEVGGVSNFTLKNCSFLDQRISSTAKTSCFEAVQFDVLTPEHISEFAYEALTSQNILVDGCQFSNVPRGIGSHNSILNNPLKNVTITNCSFSKTTSGAVQFFDVYDFTVTNNTFTDVPRAISLYSPRVNGTYVPSAVDTTGATVSALPDSYIAPSLSQNITITGNHITCSGEDAYNTGYEESGILLSGYVQAGSGDADNPRFPAGDYYISGATIANNQINAGNGIILRNTKNTAITGNTLQFSSNLNKKYRGIYAEMGCDSLTVSNNQITYFPTAGISLRESNGIQVLGNTLKPTGDGIVTEKTTQCTITSNTVNNMGVDNPKNNGISVTEYSSVNNIMGNDVRNYLGCGISVTLGANVISISKNTVASNAKSGIFVEWSSVSSIKENTLTNCCRSGDYGAIYVGGGGKVDSLLKNKITSPAFFGIQIEYGEVPSVTSNTITKASLYSIVVYNNASVEKISKNNIANGKSLGIHIENTAGELTVSSNTIKKCATAQIFINRAADSPCVTVSQNTVTGASKKTDGIRVDAGVVKLATNKLTSCRYAILLKNQGILADVQPNTYKNNKYSSVKYKPKNKYVAYKNYPSAPTAVKAAAKSKKSIQITWNAVNNADGYLIYRSLKKNSGYELAADVSFKKTSYTNKKLKKNTKYYYKIVAYMKSSDGNLHMCSKDSKVISKKTLS